MSNELNVVRNGDEEAVFDEAFTKSMTLLSSAFGRDLSSTTLRVWRKFLGDHLTPKELIESVKTMVLTRQLRDASFPTAQELVDAVKGDKSTFVYDQWALIRKALRQSPGHADYKTIIDCLDVVSVRVLDVMGGIASLRDLDNTGLDWCRKDFCKMYLQYDPRRQQLEDEAIAAKRERERVEQAQAQLDQDAQNNWKRLAALPAGIESDVAPMTASMTAIGAMLKSKVQEKVPVEPEF